MVVAAAGLFNKKIDLAFCTTRIFFAPLDRLPREGMSSGTKIGEMMLLKNKVAVIYGAGGGIGGALPRGLSRGGAKRFLPGGHPAPREDLTTKKPSSRGVSLAAAGYTPLVGDLVQPTQHPM